MNAFIKPIPQYTKAHMALFNQLVKEGIPCLTEVPIERIGETNREGKPKSYCVDLLVKDRLIVEVEGYGSKSKDNIERDRYLASLDFMVLHVSNEDVLKRLPKTIQLIKDNASVRELPMEFGVL